MLLRSREMSSEHHFVSEDGSVRVSSIPMAILTNGNEDEYFERITRALKEYRWRDEDFLLATYPKNGKILECYTLTKNINTAKAQSNWI